MSACPDKLLLLHGFVDGELDAANSLAFESHLQDCGGCSAEHERIQALRARLAGADLRHRPSAALRARVENALESQEKAFSQSDRPTKGSGKRAGGSFIGGALTGLAAGVALMLLVRTPDRAVEDQLVASHVRSLLAGHLTDVATSDRHVVRPWFNGKIDFAPPVPDLKDDGFPLVGGRLDYIDGGVVAAIVYQRRLHRINLFVRPADGGLDLPQLAARHGDGYNIVRWREGGLEYGAVSDLNAKELGEFRALFLERTR